MPVRSWLRRGIVPLTVIGVFVATLTTMAVAYADEPATIDVDGRVPITAKEFGNNDCAILPPSIDEAEDGWVFVLPNSRWRFFSVTATFTDAKGGTHSADGIPAKPPHGIATSKYYVITPAGWSLSGASARVEPKVERPGTAPTNFDLLHTCPGTPKEPEPSNPTPSASTSISDGSTAPTPSGSAGSEGPDDSGLPVTGHSLTVPLLLSLGLIAAGGVIVLLARRRGGSPGTDVTD